MSKNSTVFVGLDLGDKFSYLSIVDKEGELIEETRLRTTQTAGTSSPACPLPASPWKSAPIPVGLVN
ncbi:MAG: hypothetical protein ACLFWD_05705 [Anaerolineales bacterium]